MQTELERMLKQMNLFCTLPILKDSKLWYVSSAVRILNKWKAFTYVGGNSRYKVFFPL